ncbi:MarR family winged helix-turn-helix transcriptional regulator [Tsukamurella ocularis]|uniref:MarR family winged helix-turn-helix transcriptional regulator n=1 Tax=Tsukamurella ocularis TaxID=1970234 RepID=UPI002166D79C|nr:MarR family transcriptional regulator [Tsukamurella ocularis]MCS3778454.1 DNA-binding MarR family transcriptional regulator [Tsukamurella ocularis]MCS3789155.1 DNA-binding MarR family transcriptional regulator [Tsukamurella ocularis]MCS3853006.1 DNA-binding MarR family transcriptional regulator [Tsukamurella ocularis]
MDDAARRLEREINALGRHMRARPRSMELHLDRSAYLVLLLLDYAGPSTLKEIATELELEQSTVNRQVNKAIEHGLLEADGALSGPKRIRATAAGRAAFQRDRDVKLRGIGSIMADLDETDREALISGLTALNAALAARAGEA